MLTQSLLLYASIIKIRLQNLLTDERGETNIVTMVILIGIAVALALVFKDQISKLLEGLFAAIKPEDVMKDAMKQPE